MGGATGRREGRIMADVYIQEKVNRRTDSPNKVEVRRIRNPKPEMDMTGIASVVYLCSTFPTVEEAIKAAEEAGVTYEVLEPDARTI
jgi:hypothetical protein